jgi:hypothetical protein
VTEVLMELLAEEDQRAAEEQLSSRLKGAL